MVVCIGEVLADMLGKEENGAVSFKRYAGGAPFNVACNIKNLGGKSGFVGCVGKDLIGHFLSNYADDCELDYLNIHKDAQHNTTLAFVELDKSGERKFSFYRKNTADYQIKEEDVGAAIDIADIVHLGSLMLSKKQGRKLADAVVEQTRAKGKILSFDVNYRDDIFSAEQEAFSIYKMYMSAADIVKLSEDELLFFSRKNNIEDALRCLQKSNQLMIVTLGKEGSLAMLNNMICKEDSISVQVLDTTGAGDAFYAGALSKLDGKNLSSLQEEELKQILRFGNICGALTTRVYGAVDACLNLAEVEKYI